MFAPVNEISFLSWAGGDAARFNPHAMNSGHELKRNPSPGRSRRE